MSTQKIIEMASSLNADEKYFIINSLLESIESENAEVEKIWIEESERRLAAIKSGKMKTIPFQEVFKKDEN